MPTRLPWEWARLPIFFSLDNSSSAEQFSKFYKMARASLFKSGKGVDQYK